MTKQAELNVPKSMPRKRRRLVLRLFPIVALTAYVAALVAVPRYWEPPKKKRNIVLIVIDTLRADHLTCQGYYRGTSRRICQLKDRFVQYLNMHATTPSTKPSIASLFSSLYPCQHKVVQNEDILGSDITTLAEVLGRAGYRTEAVNANPVIKKKFNYDQGFDKWMDMSRTTADWVNRQVFSILDELAEVDPAAKEARPFFLYVHYFDPHSPYQAPEPFAHFFDDGFYRGPLNGELGFLETSGEKKLSQRDLQHLIDLYDNEIRYVDRELGALMERLKQVGLFDDTLIILTSDHGEMFYEHGYLQHSNGVYQEVIHVPLLIHFPKGRRTGISDKPVGLIDIFPTILEEMGLDAAKGLMGRALQADFKVNRTIFIEHSRRNKRNPGRGVVWQKLKLVRHLGKKAKHRRYSLYDLERDPLEQQDIFEQDPRRKKMVKKMNRFLTRCKKTKRTKRTRIELDDQTKTQLKALGYL